MLKNHFLIFEEFSIVVPKFQAIICENFASRIAPVMNQTDFYLLQSQSRVDFVTF